MQIKKVLVKKDAYSLIVAILVALAAINPLTNFSTMFASKLVGTQEGYYAGVGQGWKMQYLHPILSFLLYILLLEVVLQIAKKLKALNN